MPGNVDLGAVMAGIFNLHMYSEAMALRAEAEAQQGHFIMPCIHCPTERRTPISDYWRNPTQEQISRPRRPNLQAERAYVHPSFSNYAAALEGFGGSHELAYNRAHLPDETGPNDLRSEPTFVGRSLCPLPLQPMAESGSRERTQPQTFDALRDGDADGYAADAEEEEWNVHEQTTNELSGPGLSDFPMTAGHHEIQAVKEAERRVLNAILSLKKVINDLPPQLSDAHQKILHNQLEGVSRGLSQFPDRLTSLLVRRKAELDAIIEDRAAAAQTLRVAEEKMAAAEAKEMELVMKSKAVDPDGSVTEEEIEEANEMLTVVEAREKMKKAAEMLTAVEEREKLVSERERSVDSLEEEQAFAELNRGADAALEDLADAVAAEARLRQRSTSPIAGLTAAMENAKLDTGLENISHTHPARAHVHLERETTIAAKEEELWHRETHLESKESNLHHREAALFDRERLLEQIKTAQLRLVENWKAQTKASYAGLEADRDNLGRQFGALIALQVRAEETQESVRNLIGEARGMIGRDGEDASGDEGA